jgi:hypothetical protein
MTDSSTAADKPADDKATKTQRDAVERALAAPPRRSTGSIKLGGRKLEYKVEGAFVPVVNLGQGEKRGELEAAVFTTAYQLERKAGDIRPETSGTAHWWQNHGNKTVILFVGDVLHDKNDKNM